MRIAGDIDLFVSGLHNARELFSTHGITHVISLLDPALDPPTFPVPASHHRAYTMHDTENPQTAWSPQKHQIAGILAFTKSIPAGSALLIHCLAGVSRSPAVALAVIAQRMTSPDPAVLSRMLVHHLCDQPKPNALIARHADELLGANGQIISAAAEINSVALSAQHGLTIRRLIHPTQSSL